MTLPWAHADHEHANSYRPMFDARISCDVHGKHTSSVFHYPSDDDRQTYYTCRFCFEDHFGVELTQRKDGTVLKI